MQNLFNNEYQISFFYEMELFQLPVKILLNVKMQKPFIGARIQEDLNNHLLNDFKIKRQEKLITLDYSECWSWQNFNNC